VLAAELRLGDETVHLAAGDIAHRVAVAVRPACVAVELVVVGTLAGVQSRIGDANRRRAVLHRDPVGAGVRPEVGVERAVLLHDDHDVADLVDPVTHGSPRLVPVARQLSRREERAGEREPCENDDHDSLQRARSVWRVLESEVRVLEEHDPGASRAARTVLVLHGATPAIPVLPPDPLQVLHLEQEESKDPQENRRARHTRTVAYNRATRNGPPGSSFRQMWPTSAERRRGHRSRR